MLRTAPASGGRTFKGTVHYADGATLYGSAKDALFRSQDGGRAWQKIATVPLPFGKSILIGRRLASRLLRWAIHHVIPVAEERLAVMACGAVYVYDIGQGRFIGDGTPVRGSRPLALCHAGNGRLYYGEYRNNRERTPIHVMGSEDGGLSWRSVRQLKDVRHIHGIYLDSYDGSLWMTTGDEDNESALWRTRDHFQSLEKVAAGRQQFRAVQLLFTEGHVYWGSDSPYEVNHIYRWSRSDGSVQALQPVDGPVFFGAQNGRHLFFSTVCEPSQVNRARRSTVWHSTDSVAWRPLVSFHKDRWPFKLFQYGQVLFPQGPGSDHLWMTPFAVRSDGVSQGIPMNDLENNQRYDPPVLAERG